jgi:prepilin-type N-terminal cleavage/methylation domain-containing protein
MHSPRIRIARGLTLIELMIVVAVVAVLAMLAAPSFADFILLQRLKGAHAQLVTDLQFARSEAAARGLPVNVRVSTAGAGGSSCYVLFSDTATPPSDACDCLRASAVRCKGASAKEVRSVILPGSLRVGFSTPNGQDSRFAYDPVNGAIILPPSDAAVPPPPTFTIRTAVDAARSLAVVVSAAGRPTVCAPAGSTMSESPCP